VEVHKNLWIARYEKSRFYPVLGKIRIKNSGYTEDFYKVNVRNHSYRKFYPVLAKIWINRIRINRGLL